MDGSLLYFFFVKSKASRRDLSRKSWGSEYREFCLWQLGGFFFLSRVLNVCLSRFCSLSCFHGPGVRVRASMGMGFCKGLFGVECLVS